MTYVQRPHQERSIGLPNVEYSHILKRPNVAIQTRKKERVEFGDISYQMREDVDRTSDAISYYQRGVNPSVSVDAIANRGFNPGGIGYGQQYYSPIAVNRDGAFRFPILTREETSDALSRLPFIRPGIQSGITLPTEAVQQNVEKRIDKQLLKATVRPSHQYNIGNVEIDTVGNHILDPIHVGAEAATSSDFGQPSIPEYTRDKQIINASYIGGAGKELTKVENTRSEVTRHVENSPLVIRQSVSVAAGVDGETLPTFSIYDGQSQERFVKEKPILSYLTANFTIGIKDELSGNITKLNVPDKERIKIASRADHNLPIDLPPSIDNYNRSIKEPTRINIQGKVERSYTSSIPGPQNFRMKDYKWTIIQSAPEVPPMLVLEHRLGMEQIRTKKQDIISVSARAEHILDKLPSVNVPMLDKPRNNISLAGTVISPYTLDKVSREVNLHEKIKKGSFLDRNTLPKFEIDEPSIHLNNSRNLMRKKVQDLRGDSSLSPRARRITHY